MMTTNQEFKNAALGALKGCWAPAVLTTLIYAAIYCLVSGASSIYEVFYPEMFSVGGILPPAFYGLTGSAFLVSIFVLLPLSVGFTYAFNALYVWSDSNLISNTFGYGFKIYWRAIAGSILASIFTFLWSLLLVIPGIIKAYSYALTPYILVDDPDLSVRDALRKSQRLMQGQKFNLFYLQLSFIGWFLLACVTCGIGFLWLIPYYQSTVAVFYNNLRNE